MPPTRLSEGSDLNKRLAALRRRLWMVATFRGVAWLVACVLLVLLVGGLLDWRWHLPGLVRGALLAGLLGGAGVIVYRLLLKPLSEPADDLSLALRIEERYPSLNDALASTVQFLERGDAAPEGESAGMRREAVRRAMGRAGVLDFQRVVDARGLWKAGLCSLAALLPAVVLTLLAPVSAGTALARLAMPFSAIEWPRKTRIELESVTKKIGRNREYRLRGVVKGVIPKEATLELTHQGFPTQRRPLAIKADEDGESYFVMHLRPTEVHRDFTFRISASDAVTPEYSVKVLPLPSLVPLDDKQSPQVRLDVPRYTDLPSPQHLPAGNGNLDLVAGTVVTLRAATDRPLRRAWIEYLPEATQAPVSAFLAPLGSTNGLGVASSMHLGRAVYQPIEATLQPDRKRFSVTFRPTMHGSYVLFFEDENELVNQRQYELRLKNDPAPVVRMDRPSSARDMLSTVLASAELPLQVTVEDTMFAVRSAWLEYRLNSDPRPRLRLLYDHRRGLAREAAPLTGLGVLSVPVPRLRLQRLEFNQTFALKTIRHEDGSPLKEGDVVTLQACADDFDDVTAGKEPGRSPSVEIRIVGRPEFESRVNQEQGQIQQELQRLHQKQREALQKVQEVEARVRKGGKMAPEREAVAAEEKARQAREEATEEEAKADKAANDAEKKKHQERAAQLRQKAEEEAKKAAELRKQAQQLAEAEELQQQIARKIGDEKEGLRADIDRLRQTLRQNGMEKSGAMDRMTAVARELDRLAEKELQQIEPKLAAARKLDEMQDEQVRKERQAELERRAIAAEQEARAEEEKAKKFEERVAKLNEEAGKTDDAAEAARKQNEARQLEQQARQARQKAGEKRAEAEQARKEAKQPVDPGRPRRELAEARRGQEEVEKSLGSLLQDLEPWSSTREVKDEAARILQEQKALQERIEEMERKGLTGKDPEALAREEKAELDEIQQNQKRLAERTAQLLQKMKRMAADRAEKDPDTAREMLKAASDAEAGTLQEKMKEAEAKIGQNKLNEAKKNQREAVAQLEKLTKNLEDRREAELDRLSKKLREAERKVEELMDEQEKLQRKIRDAEKIKDPKQRAVLVETYPHPAMKAHNILHGLNWRCIPASVFLTLPAKLGLELPAHLAVSVQWRQSRRDGPRLPRSLPVTAELLTFLGLMLAEGHCSHDRFALFACHDEEIRAEFFRCAEALGVPYTVRPNSDVQISSRLWTVLCRRFVGARSREKHLPPFWAELSGRQLGVLLRAYLEGDGGVERPMVTMTTASRRLASELAYAFLALDIWARIRPRWKRATNSDHAGDRYYHVCISGQEDLRRLAEGVGFLSARKKQKLSDLLGFEANTNVDVIPVAGAALRHLRVGLGLSKKSLARVGGATRGASYLYETGARRPSRAALQRLLDAYPREETLFDDPAEQVRSLRPLLQARWARVAAVEEVIPAHPFVYDFTVEDHETFLAGHGGVFVHNTFTASCIIEKLQKPTLVLAHNKTLAAQLYKEFKGFFPHNAVQFFISYYDYYQPEAYIPQRDIYIEKDAMVNENIDRLRLAATSALVSRADVLIVASVSCIYGLGSPSDYKRMMVRVARSELLDRDNFLLRLVDIQYQRNDVAFGRGTFRVRGDTVEVWPAYEEFAMRIELFGDEVEKLALIDPLTGETLREEEELYIYPAKHFVTPDERIREAVEGIRAELEERRRQLRDQGKLLEEQRLAARTNFDVEMLLEVGHCPGVENYARFFSGRKPGEPPYTLMDFFPEDFLMIVDESHATLPQLRGMFAGDHSRKLTLVEHGFRLPSALDNRPYRFDEWEKRVKQVLFMSATPGPYELERTGGEVVEQIIRPTGLVDPLLHVRPARGQVKDLEAEIRKRAEIKERTLVTTLTKRLAEDLSNYFRQANLRCRWLHSELDAIERVQILRELREGAFDVLVGVNLLREGLDLPEVSLVAILDADKEGFLRSQTSLIQTIGRAARNVNAEVILYADKVTDSMRRAIDETSRRRTMQMEYNARHGITPTTVQTAITKDIEEEIQARKLTRAAAGQNPDDADVEEMIEELHAQMLESAANQRYEEAAQYRDQIMKLRGEKVAAPQPEGKRSRGRRKRS